MRSPVRLPGGWWLVRDTSVPAELPPRTERELLQLRTDVWTLRKMCDAYVLRFGANVTIGSGPVWTPLLEPDPAVAPRVACSECGRAYGVSHLGTCSGALAVGGPGVVGFRRAVQEARS